MVNTADMRSILREDQGVRGTEGMSDGMEAMLQEQIATAEPEKPLKPQPLSAPAPGVFRFRTKPGHRNCKIAIMVPPTSGDRDADVKLTNQFERAAKRNLEQKGMTQAEIKKRMKLEQEIYEIVGDRYIDFKPLRGKFEAIYKTANPKVAAYIRDRIDELDLPVYEDISPVEVMIKGQKVLVMPADDASRSAMARAAAGD